MNKNKLQPAIIGGVVLGLLSAIPFVNIFNACCCAWAILGGALAVYLYIQKSATPVKLGDGALLGVMAGGIGALINILIGLPLKVITGAAFSSVAINMLGRFNPDVGDQVRAQLEAVQSQPFSERLLLSIPGALIESVLLAVFATLGGLLAVALLEKRKGDGGAGIPPPITPSQPFGGQPGGYGGAGYAPPPAPPFSNQPPGDLNSGGGSNI
jgi:hypothetical protein